METVVLIKGTDCTTAATAQVILRGVTSVEETSTVSSLEPGGGEGGEEGVGVVGVGVDEDTSEGLDEVIL